MRHIRVVHPKRAKDIDVVPILQCNSCNYLSNMDAELNYHTATRHLKNPKLEHALESAEGVRTPEPTARAVDNGGWLGASATGGGINRATARAWRPSGDA